MLLMASRCDGAPSYQAKLHRNHSAVAARVWTGQALGQQRRLLRPSRPSVPIQVVGTLCW